MPRRRRLRKIVAPPGFKGYKPYGHRPNSKKVELLYEEYEAIKLADYDLLNQLEASKLMGISRATFARIYESARRKLQKHWLKRKKSRPFLEMPIWMKTGMCATNVMLVLIFLIQQPHVAVLCVNQMRSITL
nr:DUF134 domain-containing protein [uncultured Carboxylicivirga sp.]